VLVHGRILPAADAVGRRRLSLPGLPAQGGGACGRRDVNVTGTWNVRTVLLDMDGTLLDTERVYFDSLVAVLRGARHAANPLPVRAALAGTCTLSARDTRAGTKDMHPDALDVQCSATIDAQCGTSDLDNS
jgi:hypothetical protein